MVQNSCISSTLPDLPSAILYPSCETSFSQKIFLKLKLNKNYLRNKMSESRLSALASLGTEHETRLTDMNEIINKFFLTKRRRHGTKNCMQLQYVYPGLQLIISTLTFPHR
jgi:hypothetical protein